MLDKACIPQALEKEVYEAWQQVDAFSSKHPQRASPYSIIMPPPNVTGSLHLGHALTFTIQDVLVRYHRMLGKRTLWQPGTDHAGIATQMVVERLLAEKGKTRHDIGRDAFLSEVWKWKDHSGGMIVDQLKKLGASADWERERFTMDAHSNQSVNKVFVKLYEEGLIYKDKRLVNWDAALGSAVSDLEVVQKEQKGHLWYMKYPLVDDETIFITVATTRPETFFGDVAVAVHPDDERYAHLIGKKVRLPLVNREIPIIGDIHSDPQKGTGAVKITPAHDFNDFEVGKRHTLTPINIFDAACRMNENVPSSYQGLTAPEARARVLDYLKENGFLEKEEAITHAVPYSERSGVVIEPLLTDQWFVDAKTLAKPAIKAVEEGKTKFVPESWSKTYFEWMRNIQPWCISRQIWWGHQIPAWYGPDGALFVAETEEEADKKALGHYGGKVSLTRESDVLDTWFSSALWPFTTLDWQSNEAYLKTFYPTDVLVTGFDIIFFWVARMMMMGLHFMGEVPFKTVYIHALVRDQYGQKMSKSKGNVIDPLHLITTYGADALRFTLARLAAPGRDIKLSEQKIEASRNFVTKLWNAARYLEMNACTWHKDFAPTHLKHPLNQWIVGETILLSKNLEESLQLYKFHEAGNALYQFLWKTFCDWHVEFTKPLLTEGTDAEKEETRVTLAWVFGTLLHYLHPFMPFVTEKLWRALGGDALLIRESWPQGSVPSHYEKAGDDINAIIALVSEIRAMRAEVSIAPSVFLTLAVDAKSDATFVDHYETLIKRLARLDKIEKNVTPSPQFIRSSLQLIIGKETYYIPVEGLIDVRAEKARLEKQLAKTKIELETLQKRLQDHQFVSKAPEDILEEQKERAEELALLLRKCTHAHERIKALL